MPITIYAVGDIMLGEQPLCENFGVKAVLRAKGTEYLFREVSPLLLGGDIVFGNLECALAYNDMNLSPGSSFFLADGAAACGLKEAGFTILSVANNHIMENGRDHFLGTVRALRQHGITPVGVRDESPILNVKGKRVAFLAYSFIEDDIVDVCYNKVQSEKPILANIRAVRPEVDIVIVSLHWGFEYIPFPSPDQIRIGRALVDAGADVILGSHPHVTQSFELYRKRPIFYSLGNFVFDEFVRDTRESFIAKIIVGDSDGLYNVEVVPVQINKHEYFPKIVASPAKERTLMLVDETRFMIEDTVVSSYEERLGDYNQLYHRYKCPAHRDMIKHFIVNIPRYSATNLNEIIKSYFVRRVGKQK
jgi:gamma-polyglutamate biosynthesis protein CapA